MTVRRWEQQALGLMVLALSLVAGCEVKKIPNPGAATPNSVAVQPAASMQTEANTPADQSAGSKPSAAGKNDKPTETISAEGSSTVYPVCQAFAVEFEKMNQHKVSVGRSGTGGGYKRFANRQADIWNASRPVAAKEEEELKSKGIEAVELKIAIDGIVIAVHPQNGWCSKLTCGQLKRIWEPDSQVQTWKDLNSAWPPEQIVLFGADTDSGTFEYFTEAINGKKGASNIRYTPASDDNLLVKGIATNKYALGYLPFGYYIENTERMKALEVSADKDSADGTTVSAPYISPTEETILTGEYAPLSRPLFMYANKSVLLSRPEVAQFLTYVLSDASQALIQERGLVRVRDNVRLEMQQKLKAVLTGTAAN